MSSVLSIIGESRERKSCCPVSVNVKAPDYSLDPRAFRGRAAVITLGCAKNQVDSEVMLGVLKNSGFEIVSDVTQADVAVVNTCGFLESSVKESVDCIIDVADLKKTGRLRQLIVAGCVVERYKDDLKKTLPEVDSFISTQEITKVGEVARNQFQEILDQSARPYFLYDDSTPRLIASLPHTAYVKVSEGCDRPCTFCIIPRIRGAQRSRDIASVVREVQSLGAQGVKEINLVAQDLTSYGSDLGLRAGLPDLIEALDASNAVPWIRLLYSYPIGIDERLLASVQNLPRICEYLDLPLQHASERVLKDMRRPLGRYSPRKIVEFIRAQAPQVHLRTTFIVGFPGETEEDVADLENFIAEGHFTSVGIFQYSQEEGTPSHEMPNQVEEKEKKHRRDHLMKVQQRINDERLSSYIDKTFEVLVEGPHEDTDMLLSARTRFQAPDVDGTVIINEVEGDEIDSSRYAGSLAKVRITEVAGYDMIGSLVRE